MDSNGYLAVFDSGVGGLSVLRHLRKILPDERYIYYGDCANAPYGARTTEEVRQLTLAAVENLLAAYPVKALVVACNTATAAAIRDLREKYPQRIIIGIEPALKLAADHFPGGRIGVMATEVTLREEKFDHLLHRFEAGCAVEKIPAPGLVELIEQGWADTPQADALVSSILAPYVGKLDALVLGCTHYPFAAKAIARVLGAQVQLLDGGEGTAKETKRRLEAAGLLRSGGAGDLILTSSGDTEKFTQVAQTLL
ncbi:MAG: glutamate racemase [Oscillospiraceae bacterium]|nr:glutamate racemase [Oscillospiraceae bacterium]